MIKAVIFDMDGLLIDSEPLWHIAEIEVFGKLGVPLTDEMCLQVTGLRVDEVVDYWHAQFPWDDTLHPRKVVRNHVVDCVIEQVRKRGLAKQGVRETIEFFLRRDVRIALATSSDWKIIDAVLERLQIRRHFELLHSAESEDYGKPHPAVFMTTARKLGVLPDECLVFEDSVNGVLAAKAARMHCIAVPEAAALIDKRFGIADMILPSLETFDEKAWAVFART